MKPIATAGLMVAVSALTVASCNALWGVGDLEFGGAGGGAVDGGQAGSGGVAPDGSAGGASGGGGAGGGLVCDEDSCASCVTTGCATGCSQEEANCKIDEQCHPFAECVHQCEPGDATCQSACALASPSGVHSYYRWLDCAACTDQNACEAVCADRCSAGCATGGACLACANDSCAQTACEAEVAACAANAVCLSFNTCITDCADPACEQQCVDNHGDSGVELFNTWVRCVLCTKAACWDDCEGTMFPCEGY